MSMIHEPTTDEISAEIESLRRSMASSEDRIGRLLLICADGGNCSGCGAPIWWMKTKRGRPAPFDSDLTPHFATCPKADRFRKER